MTEGFVQLITDSVNTGKQLDNDVVTVPAGTVVSDGAGNLTTLTAPAFYFRERVVNADPTNPVGVATVRDATGPNVSEFGLSVRMPAGQADLQTIAGLLLDIDNNIAALVQALGAGTMPTQMANYAYPVISPSPGINSPSTPRQQVCDVFGRTLVVPHVTREALASSTITITSTTAAQTLIAAAGANIFTDLVAVIAINTSATATELDISDGTQTITMYLPAGDMRGISLGGVLIKATSLNTAWTATTLTSVASVKVWAEYAQNRNQ